MTVTEVAESGISFNSGANNGLGTANVGTWTYDTNTAYSGGHAMYSSTAGDSCTYAFSGRALYLLTRTNGHGATDGGEFTVQIDGSALPGKYSCENGSPLSSGAWYRYLVPVARNLSDGAHSVTITAVGGKNIYIDSLLVITGTVQEPTAGNLVVFGDSWMNGATGASQPLNTCVNRLTALLATKLQRGVTLVNKGLTGDKWYGQTSALPGGMYRLLTDVIPNNPEYLVMLFGANDLGGTGGGSAADWLRTLTGVLAFLEDTLDTGTTKIVLGTPGYTGPALAMPSYVYPVSGSGGSPQEMYESCVAQTYIAASAFPWLRLAEVAEAMDYRSACVYPNSNADLGNHPNDFGHGVVATELFRACLGL